MAELTVWLKTARWLILFLLPFSARTQLTLDSANAAARTNYPLVKQKDLINQTSDISIENLGKGFLPQLSVNGQATYQSEVTKVDVPIPNIKIDAPEKDQYKLTADITQLLYDGGMTRQQKSLQQLNAAVSGQQVEVELYRLRERINQVYLSILLFDQQLQQVDLVKADIQTGIKRVQAQVENGVAFRSQLNTLKAELLKNDQRLIELRAGRKALLETLGLFMNRKLDEQTILQKPATVATNETNIARPEIKLYEDQTTALAQQTRLIRARNLPKTSLFVQGGYGRPGLNLLKNEFDFFYIGGLRLNWSLGGLYTAKNERKIVQLNQDIVNTQRETFLLNTNTELRKQQQEIAKLKDLAATDSEIISLRRSVTEAAKAQLENGVITSNDYLREVNAEDQARQSLIYHEIQLLQAQINYQTIIGK